MYTIQENTVIPVDCKDVLQLGSVIDNRITAIEQLVANYYDVSVHDLDVSYRDTPAKLMCCFLLHDLLNYSIGSLANKYKVYQGFLRNKIKEHYIQCLQDALFMCEVTAMRDAYLQGKELSSLID